MSMDTISISKLIKKSINQKLPPKLFISLFNKLIKKQSINNEEFINELLILDYDQHTCSSFSSLKQHKWNEYKQTLIIELSFSNVENNHLFWNNLNQIPNNLQCKYLSKITKLLSHQSQHYDKEVLKNFIKNEIIDYVMKYTSITSITTTTTTTTTTSTIKTRWYINKPALCQTPTRKSSRYGSCYSFVGIKGKERNHQTCCVGEIAQEKGTRQGIYQFDRRSVSAIFRYFNQ